MKKSTKILGTILGGGLIIYLLDENRKQAGIIQNQASMIENLKNSNAKAWYQVGKLKTR